MVKFDNLVLLREHFLMKNELDPPHLVSGLPTLRSRPLCAVDVHFSTNRPPSVIEFYSVDIHSVMSTKFSE